MKESTAEERELMRGLSALRPEVSGEIVNDLISRARRALEAREAAALDRPDEAPNECLRCGRPMRVAVQTPEGLFHQGCHTDDQIQRRQYERRQAALGTEEPTP